MAPKDDLETLFAKRREIDRALLDEHSREVVILFTDIVGSTQYFEAKGDIAGLELVRRHNALLFPIVEAHAGWIVKTIGDAIMAVFEQPAEAVRCAIGMQRALAKENAAPGEPIHIRIGAHWGRALVEDGKDVFGDAVNTAARVVNEARGDEIVISRALADRLEAKDGFTVAPRGSFQPKGKTDPVQLVAVHWREGVPVATELPAPSHAVETRQEVFVLELQVGAHGLKVAAIDGAAGKGTVKAYADVDLPIAKLDQLSERFDPFMRAVPSPSYVARVKELGTELFGSALSERAQQHLGETGLRFLRLQLDDHLVGVPWELMHDGHEFLALRFAVGRVISARAEGPEATRRSGDAAASGHALVVSNPSGDLEAALREGEAVAGLLRDGYGGEVRHLRGPVTREELLSALKGCALLHFAGHTEHPTAASRGGFRVADGIVTPDEIAQAVGASAPALVFANGCHASTAEAFRGEAPNPPDLASALLLRGARHFVGPRWEISDEDALTFALRFYERALSGAEFGEAVRLARLALRDDASRPLSFAGYVLYGEPRDGLPRARIGLSRERATRSTVSRDQFPAVSPVPPPPGPAAGPPKRRRTALIAGVAVGVAGVVGVAGYLGWRARAGAQVATISAEQQPSKTEEPRSAPTGPVRLCMLPFKNISGEKDLDQLSQGMAEALTTDFGGNSGIRVIERPQVDVQIGELEFENSRYVDPAVRSEIGKIKGAEVVLIGGFQRAGNVVRANARFVHVESGEVLQAMRADVQAPPSKPEKLLELQDKLAEEVNRSVPEVVQRLRK